jgi:hypothetical protein
MLYITFLSHNANLAILTNLSFFFFFFFFKKKKTRIDSMVGWNYSINII